MFKKKRDLEAEVDALKIKYRLIQNELAMMQQRIDMLNQRVRKEQSSEL